MPGIYGACGVDIGLPLEAVANTLRHFPWHVHHPPAVTDAIVGGCVALTSPLTTARTIALPDIVGWIHGELYGTRDEELVQALFAADAAIRLRRIDGNFSVAAWHRDRRALRLATDRLGLRHLYWARRDDGVVWASEAKACAAMLPEVTVRGDAARELVEHGHLRGHQTWFAGIELVAAATLITFDPEANRITTDRYWAWPSSPRRLPDAEVRRIAHRIAERWREIHETYVALPGQPVITLSGGLDSRAILAAARTAGATPALVTFGRPHCLDVTLARQAAAAAGLTTELCELAADNWLDGRSEGTWITDGELDLQHMHVVRCLPRCREIGDVVLNGFLGDALIGGGYLSPRWTTEQRYAERGRRFISGGTRLGESYLLHRLPFCDAELVELSLALPEKLRAGGTFYRQFLVDAYPQLFARIGHTPHGAMLMANPVARTISAAHYWFRGRYRYHDYSRWLTDPSAAERLAPHLDPSRARFAGLLDERVWSGPLARWRARCDGRRLTPRDCNIVLRVAGIDIWLQQIAKRLGPASHA